MELQQATGFPLTGSGGTGNPIRAVGTAAGPRPCHRGSPRCSDGHAVTVQHRPGHPEHGNQASLEKQPPRSHYPHQDVHTLGAR